MPGGYGWIFPKGDHLNVGVGGWAAEGPRLRDHLASLCAEHGIALDALTSLRGHRLPMRRSWGMTARGRAESWATPPGSLTRCPATACSRRS